MACPADGMPISSTRRAALLLSPLSLLLPMPLPLQEGAWVNCSGVKSSSRLARPGRGSCSSSVLLPRNWSTDGPAYACCRSPETG